MKAAKSKTFRLPKTSESDAAGRLIRIPGMVEAEATIPSRSVGVPRLVANGLSTGFFDIVELRIANKPIMQIMRKNALSFHVALNIPSRTLEKKHLARIYFLLTSFQKMMSTVSI
jgi:hypothetical protein